MGDDDELKAYLSRAVAKWSNKSEFDQSGRFNLKKAEKRQHQQAVYHTLNNAEIGSITAWYSKKRQAGGKVRVIHQFPTSDGYCRVYQSYIKLNGAERHMTNKACKRLTNPWVFLK